MSTLYSTIKNLPQRNKLIRQLGIVVAGTKATGYAFLKKADADKLLTADTTLVTLDATGTLNDKGEIAVAATTAGVTAFEANGPVENVVRSITPSQPFELETDVPLPEYRKAGGGSAYPVDKLEMGQALFVADVPAVAATATTPAVPAVDAHKVLASVAATANRKYKDATPRRFFSVRGKQTNKAGKTGARIWRVNPPAPNTPAADVDVMAGTTEAGVPAGATAAAPVTA